VFVQFFEEKGEDSEQIPIIAKDLIITIAIIFIQKETKNRDIHVHWISYNIIHSSAVVWLIVSKNADHTTLSNKATLLTPRPQDCSTSFMPCHQATQISKCTGVDWGRGMGKPAPHVSSF
jgi:hypothetical protein